MLLLLMEGLALTPETLTSCIGSGLIDKVLSSFHNKQYLHSERSPSQSVCATLGESLRTLVECNEKYEDPVMSAITYELNQLSIGADLQFHIPILSKNETDYHHFFFALCILITHFVQGMSDKCFKKFWKMGSLRALLNGLQAAYSSPKFLLSCLSKSTLGGSEGLNEIDFCYGQLLDLMDHLLAVDDIEKDVLSLVVNNLQSEIFEFGTIVAQDPNLLSALSDDIDSIVHSQTDKGLLDIYRDESLTPAKADAKSRTFLKCIRHAMAVHFYLCCIHSATEEEHLQQGPGGAREHEGCLLERDVSTVAHILTMNGALQMVAKQCQSVWRVRLEERSIGSSIAGGGGSGANSTKKTKSQNAQNGRIKYRLLVGAEKVRVKEKPDKNSRTLFTLGNKRGVHAVRRVEVVDEEETGGNGGGNMYYELADGGWVSQVKRKGGDLLQVSLVALDWEEFSSCSDGLDENGNNDNNDNGGNNGNSNNGNGNSDSSDFEKMQERSSVRQTGAYVFESLFNTLELFITTTIAHQHSCLLGEGTNGTGTNTNNHDNQKNKKQRVEIEKTKHLLPNIMKSLEEMCSMANTRRVYQECGMRIGGGTIGRLELLNDYDYDYDNDNGLGRSRSRSLVAPFSVGHINTIQQSVCVCTGILFGKSEYQNEQSGERGRGTWGDPLAEGVNVMSLLHLLYGGSESGGEECIHRDNNSNNNSNNSNNDKDDKDGKKEDTSKRASSSSSSNSNSNSVLASVLQGSAATLLACLPFPADAREGIRANWDTRRAAALAAVDEIVHFWFLLLYVNLCEYT